MSKDTFNNDIKEDEYSQGMVLVESTIDLTPTSVTVSETDEQTHGLLQEDEEVKVSASIIDNSHHHTQSEVTGSDCICFCCCHPCFERQRHNNPTPGEALVTFEKSLIVLSVVNFILALICSIYYPLIVEFFVIDFILIIFGFIGSVTKRKTFIRIFYGFSVLFVLLFIVAMIVVAIYFIKSAINNNGIAIPSWSHQSKLYKKIAKNIVNMIFGGGDDDDGDNTDTDTDDDDDDNHNNSYLYGKMMDGMVYLTYFLIVLFFILDLVCRIKAIKAAKYAVIALMNEENENGGDHIVLKDIGGNGSDSGNNDSNDNNGGGVPGTSPEFNNHDLASAPPEPVTIIHE